MKTYSLEVIILDLHTIDHGSSPGMAIIFYSYLFVVAFLLLFLLLLFLLLRRPALLSSVHSYQRFYMFAVLLAYVSIVK